MRTLSVKKVVNEQITKEEAEKIKQGMKFRAPLVENRDVKGELKEVYVRGKKYVKQPKEKNGDEKHE